MITPEVRPTPHVHNVRKAPSWPVHKREARFFEATPLPRPPLGKAFFQEVPLPISETRGQKPPTFKGLTTISEASINVKKRDIRIKLKSLINRL